MRFIIVINIRKKRFAGNEKKLYAQGSQLGSLNPSIILKL